LWHEYCEFAFVYFEFNQWIKVVRNTSNPSFLPACSFQKELIVMLLRKFSIIALVAMAIGGFTALASSDASAQASDTGSANINATINNPIVLNWVQDMDFGEAAPSTGATTVILAADGTVTGTAIGKAGAPQEARFSVSGLPTQTYAVALPDDVTVTLAGPGDPMTVTGFSHDATGTLTSAATQPDEFGVGATLNINAEQLAGSYSGSFDVTVNYN
jgi:hypothetical protein